MNEEKIKFIVIQRTIVVARANHRSLMFSDIFQQEKLEKKFRND